jgi:hypothetical protein
MYILCIIFLLNKNILIRVKKLHLLDFSLDWQLHPLFLVIEIRIIFFKNILK